MGKFKTVLTGVLLGAGGMYVALQYHLIRAEEGLLMVRRTPEQGLLDSYADIRQWSTGAWTSRSQVAAALTETGRSDLIVDQSLQQGERELRESLGSAIQGSDERPGGWEPSISSRSASGTGGSSIRTGSQSQTQDSDRKPSPWASLFGIRLPPGKSRIPAQRSGTDQKFAPVVPAARSNRPTVEILPSPDEVDLGRSAPLPGGKYYRYPQRTGWEAIDPDRRAGATSADVIPSAIMSF